VQLFEALDGGAAPSGGGSVRRTNLKTVDDDGVAPRGGGSAGFTDQGTEVKDGLLHEVVPVLDARI
jgi:hypothetical protein